MLTRIADRKIPCIYIHVYWIAKNWEPGPHNSLRHVDNRRYISGLSLTRNRREAHMFHLVREVGIYIMIIQFKHGKTWEIWPSPLSLSLCNPLLYFFTAIRNHCTVTHYTFFTINSFWILQSVFIHDPLTWNLDNIWKMKWLTQFRW